MSESNYYDYGNSRQIVISNSALSQINPQQGGHPIKFIAYLEGKKEEKESKALERGKVLHKYAENKDSFIIADFEKPSSPKKLDLIGVLWNEDYNSATYQIYLEEAAIAVGYKRPPKFLEKDDLAYLDHLHQIASGKNVLTRQDKAIVESQVNALESNAIAYKYFLGDVDDGCELYKEMWINFKIKRKIETSIPGFDESTKEIELKCKALLDSVYIDHNLKEIVVTDLKTTRDVMNFSYAMSKYRYDRQGAVYTIALTKLINGAAESVNYDFTTEDVSDYSVRFQFLTIDSKIDPLIKGYKLSNNWLIKGKNEFLELSDLVAWHIENTFIQDKDEFLNGGYGTLPEPYDDLITLNKKVERLCTNMNL